MIKNEFYEEVTGDEFLCRYFRQTKEVDMNLMHLIKLEIDKSLIDRLNSLGHRAYNYHYNDKRVLTSSSLDVVIFEVPDEWYYIFSSISRKYYKCDQFDGLVKCLNDINTL